MSSQKTDLEKYFELEEKIKSKLVKIFIILREDIRYNPRKYIPNSQYPINIINFKISELKNAPGIWVTINYTRYNFLIPLSFLDDNNNIEDDINFWIEEGVLDAV